MDHHGRLNSFRDSGINQESELESICSNETLLYATCHGELEFDGRFTEPSYPNAWSRHDVAAGQWIPQ
jgi:hypothetical protein